MGTKRKTRRTAKARHSKGRPGLLVEAAENIEEGAGVVGERISSVAEKTVEVAGGVLDVLKEGFSQAYEAGAKAVDEVTRVAQEYAHKYKQHAEIKRLRAQRDHLMSEMGLVAYRKFKTKKWSLELLKDETDVSTMFEEIERLDREVIRIGRQLEMESQHRP